MHCSIWRILQIYYRIYSILYRNIITLTRITSTHYNQSDQWNLTTRVAHNSHHNSVHLFLLQRLTYNAIFLDSPKNPTSFPHILQAANIFIFKFKGCLSAWLKSHNPRYSKLVPNLLQLKLRKCNFSLFCFSLQQQWQQNKAAGPRRFLKKCDSFINIRIDPAISSMNG